MTGVKTFACQLGTTRKDDAVTIGNYGEDWYLLKQTLKIPPNNESTHSSTGAFMQKQIASVVASTIVAFAFTYPMTALADKDGGKGGSSGRSESSASGRSSEAPAGRGESSGKSSSESESRTRMGSSPERDAKARSERSESETEHAGYGHERGEKRQDWSAERHQDENGQGRNQKALSPEAVALMGQARQAAFEYRTSGSAQSLSALQSIRTTLAGMGYTQVPSRSGAAAGTTGGTAPVTNPGTTVGTAGVAAQ